MTSEIGPVQWRALAAAMIGWTLDAMDVMLYAFALTAIRTEFALDAAGAGALASVTLLASAFGGTLFGWIADRAGRTRALVWSILVYSVFTALTATSSSVAELVLWRTLVGIGLGGEWSAGSVLVAETWPAKHRGKAMGLMQSGFAIGYLLAAGLAALVLPRFGWRALFLLGVAPALFAAWVRVSVPEPELWTTRRPRAPLRELLAPALLRRALIAFGVAASVLFAYWGIFTWVPAYLATPIEKGGAGLGIVRSAAWIVPVQLGAFLGYTTFGLLADRFGRRPTFLVFVFGAAAITPLYALLGHHNAVLFLAGPLFGYFGHGYFSVFGAMLAELFPSSVRATAQGLCYNAGRGVSALAPLSVGALADAYGLGMALAGASLFFVLGGILMLFLPETRGEVLR